MHYPPYFQYKLALASQAGLSYDGPVQKVNLRWAPSFLRCAPARNQSQEIRVRERKRYCEMVQRRQGLWVHSKVQWRRRICPLLGDPDERIQDAGGGKRSRVRGKERPQGFAGRERHSPS